MKDLDLKLEAILKKYNEIEKILSNQDKIDTNRLIQLNKDYADLTPLVNSINEFRNLALEIQGLEELLDDKNSSIKKMAENELKDSTLKLKSLKENLLKLLIPKDINDKKNSILEIRAGTGGEEASLFAADLFNMYQKYCDLNNWNFEILSISETGLEGIKEVICSISGKNVFSSWVKMSSFPMSTSKCFPSSTLKILHVLHYWALS